MTMCDHRHRYSAAASRDLRVVEPPRHLDLYPEGARSAVIRAEGRSGLRGRPLGLTGARYNVVQCGPRHLEDHTMTTTSPASATTTPTAPSPAPTDSRLPDRPAPGVDAAPRYVKMTSAEVFVTRTSDWNCAFTPLACATAGMINASGGGPDFGFGVTGVTRLTTHPAVDAFPARSPNGAKIAFTSNRDGRGDPVREDDRVDGAPRLVPADPVVVGVTDVEGVAPDGEQHGPVRPGDHRGRPLQQHHRPRGGGGGIAGRVRRDRHRP